jgi:hypothetical protein
MARLTVVRANAENIFRMSVLAMGAATAVRQPPLLFAFGGGEIGELPPIVESYRRVLWDASAIFWVGKSG